MKSQVCVITHFNYSDSGAIHGPAHTITSYLKRKSMPFQFLGYPLYTGKKSIYIDFSRGKEVEQEFGISAKLPLIIKSFWETIYTLGFLLKNRNKIVIAIDPLNALAAILAKKLGVISKVVFYTVDYTPTRFSNVMLNNIYHKIDEYCIKNADFVWNVSNKIVEKRHDQGLSESKNLYIPNSPSFKMGKPLSVSKVNRFNLMMITGVTHSPSFTIVIDAVSELVKKFPKLKLSIIGTGAYESELRGKISKSNLKGKVEFLGQLDHETLLATLPKGGIGLAIYTGDYSWVNYGDSMKAREYLLSGLPVIITDIVSTSEDIIKYGAGVVPNATKAGIKQAIVKLFSDENFWKKSRDNAIRLAKDSDIDKILDNAFGLL